MLMIYTLLQIGVKIMIRKQIYLEKEMIEIIK